ncbi:hypothetical protein PDESU_01223 [Pontiella desulfatans]|uniref:Uncharacterized protein n=1 Tax=Pontiella desulfatans TaxID=2750659 RepID=A0A6C2TYA8_PONDE|nr:LacI family DNA-binding transcriptional regulator [Pontiella desulfatans]VGO12670.1 hypothetical protein PDESU_01223 [Pontiella desulfatans]
MKTNRVTQKDIARRAGTSASLVSRILNGKTAYISVSDETMTRVQSAAEELGYRAGSRGSSNPDHVALENEEG